MARPTARSSAAIWLLLGVGLVVSLVGCSSMRSGLWTRRAKVANKKSEKLSRNETRKARRAARKLPTEEVPQAILETEAESQQRLAQLNSEGPTTIRSAGHGTAWELSIGDAVQMALQHNPLIRQNAQFQSPGNPLLANPDAAPSTFDPALQKSSVLFGNRGSAAAWSDFMPQLNTSMVWGKDANVQNNLFLSGGLPAGSVLDQDTANFRARLEQQLLSGGTISLTHNWDYEWNNQPFRLFPSAYNGQLGVELRQPLLAGAGYEYTKTAGPIAQRGTLQNGVFQGIRIAQTNAKIAGIDFELAVRNFVRDVGDVYWQMYQTHHELEANREVRDAAHEVWQQTKAKIESMGAAIVSQAEHTWLESRSRVEASEAQLLEQETRLRRLLGLPVGDGREIKPFVIPVTSEFNPSWQSAFSQALQKRGELLRQKLAIDNFAWQLKAAESLLQPRLDFVGNYRLNGFGDKLIDGRTSDGTTSQGFNSAYTSLLRGSQHGWQVGAQFTMPIGFVAERSQVRSFELRLAKARAALASQEHEIGHELAASIQSIDRWYTLMKTNDLRRNVTKEHVEALAAEVNAGRGDRNTIDQLLRARQSRAAAETEYHRAVASYNLALWDFEFRKGTLLEYNNVMVVPVASLP